MNKDEIRIILNDLHLLSTSGHAGVSRMINNIKKYYFWPSLYNDVKSFDKRCDSCQKQKHSNYYTKQPMAIISTAFSSFQKIFLDIIGPLSTNMNGYSYIITLQCKLTKFVEAYPLKNKNVVSVAKSFVENFILCMVPHKIATDGGY